MSIRQFCDRCYADITDHVSGHVSGVSDADEDGNGRTTHAADLCGNCYNDFAAWLFANVSPLKEQTMSDTEQGEGGEQEVPASDTATEPAPSASAPSDDPTAPTSGADDNQG